MDEIKIYKWIDVDDGLPTWGVEFSPNFRCLFWEDDDDEMGYGYEIIWKNKFPYPVQDPKELSFIPAWIQLAIDEEEIEVYL